MDFSNQSVQFRNIFRSALLRGLFLFLMLLVLILLGIEVAARNFSHVWLAPALRSNVFAFDTKVYYLERTYQKYGKIDCIFVGSSVTNTGIDPEVIQDMAAERLGKNVTCFNFGIPASTLDTTTQLTRSLKRRFSPELIIYVIASRDFSLEWGEPAAHLSKNIWVEYHHGDFSYEGWLIDSSYAYRYFITWQYWLNPENRPRILDGTASVLNNGFSPLYDKRDPYLPMGIMDMTDFWVPEYRMEWLDGFIALKDENTKLLFIDAPYYPELIRTSRGQGQGYEEDYLEPLETYLDSRGIQFIRTTGFIESVPDEEWWDWVHLNAVGAKHFSQWLANELLAANSFSGMK